MIAKPSSCVHCQAVLIDADQVLHGRYDKIDLVPFGECIPPMFSFVNRITQETGDFAPGHDIKVLNAAGTGSDSSVIAAINRAILLKDILNIRVMNLSLGRRWRWQSLCYHSRANRARLSPCGRVHCLSRTRGRAG